jgi:hypothetical protein
MLSLKKRVVVLHELAKADGLAKDQESAKELRNIYRTNLRAGLAQERPVF